MDPQLFAQLVGLYYKRGVLDDEPMRDGLDEKARKSPASIAWEVLRSWHLLPGVKGDDSVDEKELMKWIETAYEQCKETHHTIGCNYEVGSILVRMPSDPDGIM